MRKGKITRLYKGPRRDPTWDVGAPPNPRDRSPLRPARRRLRDRVLDPALYRRGVMVAAAVALVILPLGADAVATMRIGLIGLTGAQSTGCRLVSVTDGDTLRLYCPNRGLIQARLTGFDTPEFFSLKCTAEFTNALRAKWALRWMLMTSRDLKFVREGTDHYGRALVFASADGVPVARAMISRGLARPYDGGARLGWC
jgi:endonuclease YncB( thermonuclease family)